ncbi:MAG: GMC family oxidoreductase N-terminal domain-containing protein, partial [Myxococcota bacterium]|nr:GMC family oxidoreductase N-terminal domain-containing protein [Myxococcota bacterium]
MSAESSWDHVVVGAGSAGCVVAARLTEDPDCRVLLIEGGGSDRSDLCRVPGMVSIIHTVPQVKKKYDWGYKTAPRTETLDRRIPYLRGKVLGGSSAINGMVFVRGNRLDYDGWAQDGCPGWSHEQVLPYFRKLEDFELGESEYRGAGGPIKVSLPTDISPVSEAFLQACSSTCGIDIIEDYNGASQEGAALWQLSSRDGIRYSSSEGYLHPNLDRPNLEVRTGALVHRVRIEGGRATGVEFSIDGQVQIARAEREVVLCAGAVGTPAILMRSGVGPAEHLKELDIPVLADLPVGRNLHDHLFFPLTFLAPRGGHRGTAWHFFGGMIREKMTGGTWFGRSVFESVAFMKLDPASPSPDFQLHTLPWAYPSPNQDNSEERPSVDMRPAFTILPTLIAPESRGELRLLSADPDAAPHIDPHFLEAPRDSQVLLQGIELTRRIMAHGGIAEEITAELHPGL